MNACVHKGSENGMVISGLGYEMSSITESLVDPQPQPPAPKKGQPPPQIGECHVPGIVESKLYAPCRNNSMLVSSVLVGYCTVCVTA